LLKKIPAPVIKHLYTIDNLKRLTPDNKVLFDNDLAFFTEEEIENHLLLIEYLKDNRKALLCGYPATGKTIAVVDIAKRLEKAEYVTYYYSFKKEDRWAEVWEEILHNKDNNTLFVIDDIHLKTEHAAEALLRIEDFDDLNILFISREIKEVNDTDQLDVYNELKEFTIKTEQPSIDDKARGIIKKFQTYFQKKNKGKYSVKSYSENIKKSYRNLIVLREYLKFWESEPEKCLDELEEKDFYKNIYSKYFKNQNIKLTWEPAFLQYLCVYYFEINFYPNPKYLKETDALAENSNHIVDEGERRYSIYHGEYAFLLLKAYKFVNLRKFERKYKTWENFFVAQITAYFQSFIEDDDWPENLFEILNSIPRFKKDVQDGVENNNLIFSSIIENSEVREWLLEFCNEENEAKEIALFMSSIITDTPHFIKPFFLAFAGNQLIFKNPWAFGLYTSSFINIKKHCPEDLDWLEEYFQPHLFTIINNSTLFNIKNSLSFLKNTDRQKALALFNLISDDLLFEKLKTARINQIGQSLNELKNIDPSKTKTLYEGISIDDLKASLTTARINQISNALNKLKNIDPEKTKKLYDGILDYLKASLKTARIHEIGCALNQLKNIDLEKTKILYEGISIDNLKKSLKTAQIHEISSALNELKNIDPKKTKTLYEEVSVDDLKASLKTARINQIGNALNELKNIDPKKTKILYEGISIDDLKDSLKAARINHIGRALNELKNIDPEKTKILYDEISVYDLKASLKTARINQIGNALNELKNIDPKKTKILYEGISVDDLKESLKTARINDIGKALNELKNIDPEKTKTLYEKISVDELKASLKAARINDIGYALNQLKNIDPKKTKILYDEISVDDLKDSLKAARINDIGNALNELKNIDPKKTKTLYEGISVDDLKASLKTARINDIGKALNELKNINPDKTKKLYEEISVDDLKESLKTARINQIGKALNELKNIDPEKTKKLYEEISVDDLKESLKTARINDIGNVLSNLKNIDIEKTTIIYQELGNTFILKKIIKANLKYRGLLITISVFPKLEPKLAKDLFNQLPESILFNWQQLEIIEYFNILTSALKKAGYTYEEEQFKKLIDFGWHRKDLFLNYGRLQNVSSFISLMSDYKNGLPTIIKNRLAHFERLALKESQKNHVAGFIANIYQHCPKQAIHLFKTFQKKYPKDKEVTACTGYYIGKKLIDKDKIKEAYPFLLKAGSIFKQIEKNDVCEEIEQLLKEMKLE
jgi:DNA polymerase/3'-5' exonuclease PolX